VLKVQYQKSEPLLSQQSLTFFFVQFTGQQYPSHYGHFSRGSMTAEKIIAAARPNYSVAELESSQPGQLGVPGPAAQSGRPGPGDSFRLGPSPAPHRSTAPLGCGRHPHCQGLALSSLIPFQARRRPLTDPSPALARGRFGLTRPGGATGPGGADRRPAPGPTP
jgi:hypothetical protein